MTKLSVNLNKIALLRNQRDLDLPSVTQAAQICIAAGCHGITVHPRPDERHVRRADVHDLARILDVEFNIEGNPFPEFMDLVRDVRPTQCTLVPDSPGQRTSDHGWDLAADGERVRAITRELKDLGIRVSLFLDPGIDQVRRAKDTGADRIEIYTEPYAAAFARGEFEAGVAPYVAAAEAAVEAGLEINAGHDLNLFNLGPFCHTVPGVQEVSIGHALTADAVVFGLGATVKAYLAALAIEIVPATQLDEAAFRDTVGHLHLKRKRADPANVIAAREDGKLTGAAAFLNANDDVIPEGHIAVNGAADELDTAQVLLRALLHRVAQRRIGQIYVTYERLPALLRRTNLNWTGAPNKSNRRLISFLW